MLLQVSISKILLQWYLIELEQCARVRPHVIRRTSCPAFNHIRSFISVPTYLYVSERLCAVAFEDRLQNLRVVDISDVGGV